MYNIAREFVTKYYKLLDTDMKSLDSWCTNTPCISYNNIEFNRFNDYYNFIGLNKYVHEISSYSVQQNCDALIISVHGNVLLSHYIKHIKNFCETFVLVKIGNNLCISNIIKFIF